MADLKRVRVNISITTESHLKMKQLAKVKGCSVSQLLADLVSLSQESAVSRIWLQRLSRDTLERIEQFAFENHTSPEQAVTDWAWHAKVTYENLRGQMSLF